VEILTTSDSALNGQARLVVAGSRYYHLDGLASLLLIALQKASRTAAQLRDDLLQSSGQAYEEQKIEQTLDRLVAFFIVTDGTQESGDGKNKREPSSYFAIKLPLISPRALRPLTRGLAPLFTPALVAWLFPLMLVGQIVFWWVERKMAPSLYHLPSGYTLLALFLANYAGLFLHEFGHATACAKFGARHGAVGFALYLIFPALYTDVTDSWRLSRTKRVIVDAGGTYMSLMAATVASLLFLEYKSPIFAQLCLIYGLTVIVNLNPFFRMDGYWVLSDVLGVPNLMAANHEVTWWLLRFGSKKMGATPRVMYLPPRSMFTYFAYYLAFIVFMVFAGYAFYEWYIPLAVHLVPGMCREMYSSLVGRGLSLHVLALLLQILVQSIPFLGPAIYVVRSLARMTRRKTGTVQQTGGTNPSVTNTPVSAA
jgi:hypothetical protein